MDFITSDMATIMLHADHPSTHDVAVPLHVSTTFVQGKAFNDKFAISKNWLPASTDQPDLSAHVYSRETTEVRSRLESILGHLEQGSMAYAVTYGSGLSAIFAVFQLIQPKRILTSTGGYNGTHGIIEMYMRGRSVELFYIENDKDGSLLKSLEAGDLVWLESPQNPCGEVADLHYYTTNRKPGVIVGIDSTFAPPPLQCPLKHNVDIVMHSSTKFLGGHSDLLGGVLITKDIHVRDQLFEDRMHLGSNMGSMEAWLLLRSMRSYKLRILQQSSSATTLVKWLNSRISGESNDETLDIIEKVWHASIPANPGHEAALRQGSGFSGVFSVEFKSLHHARLICSNLKLFINATSLGGCESLVEWRVASDASVEPTVCRFSIGLEDVEDLQKDLSAGMLQVKKLVEDMDEKKSSASGN
ncbi:hypothetical protein MT418_000735 [Batrachochytrium dendrobatidis]